MNPYADNRYINVKVSFGLIDITAAADAEATTSSSSAITQIAQLTNGNDTGMSAKLATLEDGYFILDNTATLIPADLSTIQTGWCSSNMSDAEGNINESVTFDFDNVHDSIGFTLYFDTVAGEYPTEFTVSTYGADGLIETKEIENTSSVCIVSMPTQDYTQVVFNFTKTLNPYRHLKIASVLFGIIQTFDRSNTKLFTLLREISFDSLCTSDMEVTFDNTDRKYNMVNPAGVYSYLQQAQALNVQIGIGTSKDDIEYADYGKYYYIGSESDDDSMTATIKAADTIHLLENTQYSGYSDTTDSLINVVNDLIAATGRSINVVVPADVQAINIYRRLPEGNVRELIFLVAQAGMCAAYINLDDDLVFTKLEEATTADDTLDSSNMETWPKITAPEYKNGAKMTIDDVEYSTGGDYIIEDSNPLVLPANAITYLAWLVRNAQAFTYEIQTVGNPQRDIADTIKVYDYYGVNRKAMITKSSLRFDGKLSEDIEALGREVI